MANRLAEIMFEEHLREVLGEPDAERWKIEHSEGFVLHVEVCPANHPSERFLARVAWTDYPGKYPASIVFLDPKTLAKGVACAWPVAAGFRPPQDICANWTAEGFVAHPEWRGDPTFAWDHGDNAILTQLRHLQLELDTTFERRHHV